jgi:HK97 family phage prohead protease
MNDIEKREYQFTNESEEEMLLSGYAARYDSITTLHVIEGMEFKEVIAKGAFDGADTKDCFLKYNHSDQIPVLARTRGGSLKLASDELGLRFEAKLFNTSVAKDVYTLVREGGLDKCSFAFTIAKDGETFDRKTRTRTITKIEKLWDVSIVNNPAYESTYVSARSKEFFDTEVEKERMEMRKIEDKKKRLLLKLKIEGGLE